VTAYISDYLGQQGYAFASTVCLLVVLFAWVPARLFNKSWMIRYFYGLRSWRVSYALGWRQSIWFWGRSRISIRSDVAETHRYSRVIMLGQDNDDRFLGSTYTCVFRISTCGGTWIEARKAEFTRPDGPIFEARRAESGGGVLGEGAANPLPTS